MNLVLSSHGEYSDQVFRDLQMPGEGILSSRFFNCQFKDCTFSDSVFKKCKFVSTTFINCDLNLVEVPESLFSATRFEQSKVMGVNWAQADWTYPGLGPPPEFFNSLINYSTFIGLNLVSMRVINCTASEVDFREADLSRADFSGTDLSKSLFKGTNLTAADLSRARNYHIDPGQNVLKGARFSMPEALSLLYSMDIDLTDDL